MTSVYVVCSYYDNHNNVYFKVELVTLEREYAISYANRKAYEDFTRGEWADKLTEDDFKDLGSDFVYTKGTVIHDIGYSSIHRYAVFEKILEQP